MPCVAKPTPAVKAWTLVTDFCSELPLLAETRVLSLVVSVMIQKHAFPAIQAIPVTFSSAEGMPAADSAAIRWNTLYVAARTLRWYFICH